MTTDLIVALNKPKDITSQDAVTKVKRLLKVKKAGHTGTLDPLATGLLLVCVNRATRLASYFSSLDKEYRAVMKLGETTDTQDAYGRITATAESVETDEASITDVLRSFKGRSLQMPPMYSALKHEGTSLYKLARQGIEIERTPREISISDIELLKTGLPYVTFRAVCSKGTYIRTLCEDIGKKLGTGAHMTELERTACGPFRIENSLTFGELQNADIHAPESKGIYTMDRALSWLPELTIEGSLLKAVAHGNPLQTGMLPELSDKHREAAGIRIRSASGELLAVGSFSAEKNIIKMDVVFI